MRGGKTHCLVYRDTRHYTSLQKALHYKIQTCEQFIVASPLTDIFGRWKETTEPGGNPHGHKERVKLHTKLRMNHGLLRCEVATLPDSPRNVL